jgi:hypothetical protein
MSRRIALVAAGFMLFALACKKKTPPADAGVAAAPAPPAATAPTPPPPPPAARAKGMDDPLLKLLPKRAAVAFVLPNLDETGRLLRAHVDRHAKALGIAGRVDDLLRAVTLGIFNPFDPGSRSRWGIEGKKTAAVALDPEGKAPLLVFALASAPTFEKHLREKLAEEGKHQVDVETRSGAAGKISIVRRDGKVHMAYALKEGHAFLVPADEGYDPSAALESFLKVTPAESLAATPNFQAAAGRLTAFEDALFYFDGDGLFQIQVRGGAVSEDEKQSLRHIYDVLRGLAIAVNLTEKDVLAEMYAVLGEAGGWGTVLRGGADFALGRFLESGAILVAKAQVDGPALLDKILTLDPGTRTKLNRASADFEKRTGVHLERDLLRNLTGRFAAALSGIEPALVEVMASRTREEETIAQFHVVVAAEIKDAAAFEKVVARAVEFLGKRAGARTALVLREHGGVKFHELTFKKKPLLAVAIVDGVLVATLGRGRMEKTLDLIAGKSGKSVLQEIDPAAREALAADHNAVFYLRFGSLLDALKGLNLKPLGRRGAAFKAILETRVGPLFSNLRDLVLTGKFDGQGIKLRAALRGP